MGCSDRLPLDFILNAGSLLGEIGAKSSILVGHIFS